MKLPFILVFVLIINTNFLYSQTTAIPDVNFEQKLIDLGFDTNGLTGDIIDSDAEAVIDLNITNFNITDLSGIEAFINLESLSCFGNHLTSLDLSQNILLLNLYCMNNDLNELIIEQCPDLRVLRAYGNDLDSLNIMGLSELKELNVKTNNISEIDVNSNVNLKILRIGSNILNSIDVSLLDSLTNLSIISNNIDSIDISNSTKLNVFNCGFNPMTTLDVSDNLLLHSLYFDQTQISTIDVTMLPALRILSFQSCGMDTIDVSQNLLLENLSCINNNLTNIDLSAHSNLTQINAFGNDLEYLNVANGNNTNIITFRSHDNNDLICISVDNPTYSASNWLNIDPEQVFSTDCIATTLIPDANFEAELISQGIDKNGVTGDILNYEAEAIDTLVVPNLNIADLSGIEAFINLSYLNCRKNDIIALDLTNNTLIDYVDCAKNDLTSFDIGVNNNLKELYISNNELPSIDVTGLSNLSTFNISSNLLNLLDLANNNFIYNLSCSYNNISSLDVTNIGGLEILKINSNPLLSIDLTQNPDLDVIYCESTNIDSLDFSFCGPLSFVRIRNNGLKYLNMANNNNSGIAQADFKATGNSLSCINVSDVAYTTANWTNIDGGAFFSEDCYGFTAIPDPNFENRLIALGIDNNGFTGDIMNLDAEFITSLDVSNLNIDSITGIEAFINLNHLDFSDNNIFNVDLSSNTLLDTLKCDENNLTILSLDSNLELKHLNCSKNSINSLSISNCISLEYINSSLNNLGVFDPTVFPDLVELYLQINTINTIDVSTNDLIEKLDVSGNNLNMIDITNNGNLITVWLSSNNINTIDLTQNLLLEYLGIAGNNIINLDFSNNTMLTGLNCISNNILHLDLSNMPQFNKLTAQNNGLETLDLRNGNNITIPDLYFNIENNSLTCVNVDNVAYSQLNWNQIDPGVFFSTDCYPTTQVPDPNFENALIDLGIDSNGFTGDILNSDAEAISILDVSNLQIDSINGIEAFLNIKDLDVNNNNLLHLDFSLNTLLVSVNATMNTLMDIDVTQCPNLEELYLNNNLIDDIDVSNNLQLNNLYLAVNNLDSIDVSNNLDLVSLNLNSNNLDTIDLSNNQFLQTVRLAANQIDNIDVSNLDNLNIFQCQTNGMNSLDFRNDSNLNVNSQNFKAQTNDLVCIDVTEVDHAYSNWIRNTDDGIIFSNDCSSIIVNYWLGGVSSNWFNTANWSLNQIPHLLMDVIIDDLTLFEPEVSLFASCRTISVLRTHNLNIMNGGTLRAKVAIVNKANIIIHDGGLLKKLQ